jgi:ubiquinone/menaquinone biosynthesis C-methylase UbiE
MVADNKWSIKKLLKGQYRFFSLRAKSLLLRLSDWTKRSQHNLPVPPPMLRYRVHGRLKADGYLEVGRQCADDIKSLVRMTGRELFDFNQVLDFGCGNGRVIRYFNDKPETCRLYGTDIDAESVNWCRKNLPFAQWGVNGFMPPMQYADNAFDCVYAISVFTHLDEEMQFAWLRELQRITKTGAILILTIHGRSVFHQLSGSKQEELATKGIYFDVGQTGMFKHDGLPDFYQTTYHTRSYIDDQWSKFFKIIGYVEKGMNNHQDAVILQKTDMG